MDKATFLSNLHSERARWDETLDAVARARLADPGVAGTWAVKDVVAHVGWHEREMVNVLEQRAFVGSDLWDLDLHSRNAAIYEQNRHRAADEVLAEEQALYAGLLELIEALPGSILATRRASTDARRLVALAGARRQYLRALPRPRPGHPGLAGRSGGRLKRSLWHC